MAERLANLVVGNLGAFISAKAKLLEHVHSDAQKLKYEVENLRSFLRSSAQQNNDNDDVHKTRMKWVREAVHHAEDVLDDYHLHFHEDKDEPSGVFSLVRKKAWAIEIASQIQHVRNKIRHIKNPKRRRENLNDSGQPSDPRLDALFVEESELVGIDVPRSELVQILSGGEESLLTISVVGMGGLGKTTLVKKVYEQAKRGEPSQFDTFAWIPVSKTFQVTEVLRQMMAQFSEAKTKQAKMKKAQPRVLNSMTEMELIQKVRDKLENKKYLLIFDDVWGIDAWKSLKRALPDSQNGSRVIITTRSGQVADFCRKRPSDQVYNLQPLDPSTAWSLFCRKAFLSNEETCCPPGLQKLADSFVKKCQGLPLAIVSLGSLLAVKPHADWEMIHRSLGSELETDDHLKSMKNILLLSFDDLPYHLKSCFLFLSIFPEGYCIKRMKLIRLWIAEGLIQSRRGMSLEEVADGYLNQLIQRSLIQVAEWKNFETVKTCKLHDLVREIILPKYEEEGLFISSSSSSSMELETMLYTSSMLRRLSIHSRESETIQRYEKLTRLRSMFIFQMDNASSVESLAKLRFLRVVHIENVPLENFPHELTHLLHLRYLSLENTKIKELPDAVGKLKRLETLNLKGTFVRELPAAILQLQHLRHILVYKYGQDRNAFKYGQEIYAFNCTDGVKVPAGIGKLRSLQKLGHIEAESGVITELGNLTELRRLCVIKLRTEDGTHFCASIAKMSHLQALTVESVHEDVALDLQSLTHPPLSLRRLYLCGRLENLPRWISPLQNLVVIVLWCSKLQADPLRALQSLTNLVRLFLMHAYDGEELCCEAGGYPQLKLLYLKHLRRLKQVKVENGAMSNLVDFTVSSCKQLEEVPSCLQQLINMKYLFVSDMSERFKLSLYKERGEEFVDCVQHIKHIYVY